MSPEMKFKRHSLPVGDDQIPVLVAREGDQAKAVFMSYDSFLELAATLYTAVEALRTAGIDPSEIFGEDAGDDDAASEDDAGVDDASLVEFASWDEEFEPKSRHLSLVVGG